MIEVNKDNVEFVMDWALDEIVTAEQFDKLYNICAKKNIPYISMYGYTVLNNSILTESQKENLSELMDAVTK